MPSQKKTVSLFLYIPNEKCIVLSQRAEGQSHAGFLQATCHGGVEKGEDHADAIERELKEETGLDLVDVGPLTFLGELEAGDHKPEACSYYLASLSREAAEKLKTTPEVAAFVKITAHEKETLTTVMFDDELQSLVMAFDLLEEHDWDL